jgi:hypothetical protein
MIALSMDFRRSSLRIAKKRKIAGLRLHYSGG